MPSAFNNVGSKWDGIDPLEKRSLKTAYRAYPPVPSNFGPRATLAGVLRARQRLRLHALIVVLALPSFVAGPNFAEEQTGHTDSRSNGPKMLTDRQGANPRRMAHAFVFATSKDESDRRGREKLATSHRR